MEFFLLSSYLAQTVSCIIYMWIVSLNYLYLLCKKRNEKGEKKGEDGNYSDSFASM